MTVPLHPDLEAHLLRSPGIGKAFLFPTLAGRSTGGKHGLSGRFSAIGAKAGIEPTLTHGGVRARANLTFHSLRHSFNSAMANAGVSQEIRQKPPKRGAFQKKTATRNRYRAKDFPVPM